MQKIEINDKKAISASEVKDVSAFSEKEIKLVLLSGKQLFITGAGLKISGFDKGRGEFLAEGDIMSVRFSGAKENIVKRIFR